MKHRSAYPFLIRSIRLFLGLIYFTSGMGKLTEGNFPGLIGPVWLTGELEKYGLEYLGHFIAWSQVLTGLLLLTQRFATLGAIMLLPMQLNIFMAMFSIGLHYYRPGEVNSAINTSCINAFLLLLNAVLILHDYHRYKFILHDRAEPLPVVPALRQDRFKDRIVLAGILVCLMAPLLIFIHALAVYTTVAAGMLICIGSFFRGSRKPGSNR